MKIFPSLISADVLNLGEIIKTLNDHCDGYHIDVMDDHFVPNLTWGPAFTRAIVDATDLPIHLHLMVDNPEKWVNRVPLREDDIFIFHYEAMGRDDIGGLLEKLKKQRHKVGIAINPDTPAQDLYPYLDQLDHVLIMSVNPGFSGQKFIKNVAKKVDLLIERRHLDGATPSKFTIGMDGGIGPSNIKMLSLAGVDEVGVASSIFAAKDPVEALKGLYQKSS